MNAHDLDILTKTVWGEARGEPLAGKIAVARTVLNRWQSKKWFAGETIAETCQKPYQYSAWNWNDPNRLKMLNLSPESPDYIKCREAAEAAEKGDGPEWLQGCTHYRVIGTPAKWADGQTPAGRIGNHEFFRNIN